MQKILITGASGFVGGFLVDYALASTADVYAAVRKTSNLEYLQDDRISFVYPKYESIDHLTSLLDKHRFDYIIHNAGLTKANSKEEYFKVNSEYLQNIVKAIERSIHPPKKLTFISSLAAYGPAEYTKGKLVKETSKPNPVTNYGRSKLDAENFLKNQSIVNYAIIRPTAVYGPREKDLFTVYNLINKGLELSVGSNKQSLTFIYVKDLVQVILDATLADNGNVAYFVTDLNVYDSDEYNNLIRKALGKKRTLKINLPISLIKAVGLVSEKIGMITGNYPTLNMEKVNELKAINWQCDTSNLRKDLKFIPKYDLSLGLRETIAWYKKNNWLT